MRYSRNTSNGLKIEGTILFYSILPFQGVRGGGRAVSGGLHPLLPLVHGALQLAEEQRLQGGRRGEVRQHTEARQVQNRTSRPLRCISVDLKFVSSGGSQPPLSLILFLFPGGCGKSIGPNGKKSSEGSDYELLSCCFKPTFGERIV